MGKRWFVYLMALLGCLVFYLAYQQWVSWLLLMGVLFLPIVSLLFSIPAIALAKVSREMPPVVTVGTALHMRVVVRSKLPIPPWQVQVQAYHTLTGENKLLYTGDDCPTDHCGAINCRVRHVRVYDYMGMFRVRLRRPGDFRVIVRPRTLAPAVEPDLSQMLVTAWRPKVGGGFAENHELRLYRPGDSLQQIHWKLTAKTGKLILREPMIPDKNRMMLWLSLSGEPAQIDRKLGRLLWFSGYLHRHGLAHDILAYTGEGKHIWHVSDQRTLRLAVDALLCHSPYTSHETPILTESVNWSYYIGGEEDAEET